MNRFSDGPRGLIAASPHRPNLTFDIRRDGPACIRDSIWHRRQCAVSCRSSADSSPSPTGCRLKFLDLLLSLALVRGLLRCFYSSAMVPLLPGLRLRIRVSS